MTDIRPGDLLRGPERPSAAQSLAALVRPFGKTDRGVAFVGRDNRTDLTYQDIAARTAVAVARLRAGGVRPGATVAMTIRNDVESVLALLGIWAAGATVLSMPPVPRKGRDWYARQFDPILDNLGCEFVLTDDDILTAVHRRGIALRQLVDTEPARAALPDVPVPDTALVQFTSGSIGTPKGVAIRGATLAGHLAGLADVFHLDAEADRVVSWLPLYHDMGLVGMFLCALSRRVDQVIASPSVFAANPGGWLAMLANHGATVTAAPNFAYRLASAFSYDSSLDLSHVRLSVSGGERVSWDTLCAFHAAAAPTGLRWEALTPGYGMAEGTVGIAMTPVGRGPVKGPGGHVSVGVPVPGVELRAPADVEGPIHLGGHWLLSGYHSANGFAPADTWLDTGDGGFTADGELYVLGRRDEVLTLAGRTVFAEDLEAVAQQSGGALVGLCAAFRNAVVTDRFSLMVEANPRLVRDRDDAARLGRKIQAAVAEIIGTRPAPVLVVGAGVVPRTTSGKARRAQCRVVYNSGDISRRILAELT